MHLTDVVPQLRICKSCHHAWSTTGRPDPDRSGPVRYIPVPYTRARSWYRSIHHRPVGAVPRNLLNLIFTWFRSRSSRLIITVYNALICFLAEHILSSSKCRTCGCLVRLLSRYDGAVLTCYALHTILRMRQGSNSQSVLDGIGEEVTRVALPVSICMLLTAFFVKILNPNDNSNSNAVYIASIYYQEKVRVCVWDRVCIHPRLHNKLCFFFAPAEQCYELEKRSVSKRLSCHDYRQMIPFPKK